MNTMITFEEEKAKSIEMIGFERFTSFLFINSAEYIGMKNDKQTTVEEEVRETLKLIHIAYVESCVENIDFYNRKLAFRSVEGSASERMMKSENLYKNAAKKLLFINSKCKEMTGSHGFICKKIDRNDSKQLKALCEAFEWCVAHFDLL